VYCNIPDWKFARWKFTWLFQWRALGSQYVRSFFCRWVVKSEGRASKPNWSPHTRRCWYSEIQ
jgi:hypothetical protein